jgi:cobalt-precorrin-5B (C1)-methyltransferase
MMKKNRLKSGYTTGACAAAAAKGAAMMLRDRVQPEEVEITLPGGEKACFRIYGRNIGEKGASCYVIKDAGDDPDVTNGAEIHATVTLKPPSHAIGKGGNDCPVIIEGGVGIGRVTKPGLAVKVGEWAINPVPRRMIKEAVCGFFTPHSSLLTPHVIISIPNGEELAKKTLNARLGIIGGLSILGTTGIVRPISADAWTDTIEAAIDVALACGCETLVLSTGRTSELAAQRILSRCEGSLLPFALCPLPAESFIMMGDHAGYAIRACARKGAKRVIIAGQFAKLLKIACGHEQTHVSSSKLDLRILAGWLEKIPLASHLAPHVSQANTAREVLELSGGSHELTALVCNRAAGFARRLAPGLDINVLLAGYGGEVLYCCPNPL